MECRAVKRLKEEVNPVEINPMRNKIPEMEGELSAVLNVINQLGGLYTSQRVYLDDDLKTPRITSITEDFINALSKGKKYTFSGIKQMLAAIQPIVGDPLYDSSNPLFSENWYKYLSRFSLEYSVDTEESTLYNGLTKEWFYKNWLTVIKNDLKRTTPSGYFEGFEIFLGWNFVGNFEDDINHQLIQLIDTALSNAMSYPVYFCLLSGILAISEQEKMGMEWIELDFLLHTKKKQAVLLNDYNIKGLHSVFNERDYSFLNGKKEINGVNYYSSALEFTSLFLYGFYHTISGEIVPFQLHRESSSFLSHYYKRFDQSNIKVSQYRSAIYNFIGTEFRSYMDQKFWDEENTIERGVLYKEYYRALIDKLELLKKSPEFKGKSEHWWLNTEKLFVSILAKYIDKPRHIATDQKFYDYTMYARDYLYLGTPLPPLKSLALEYAENEIIRNGIDLYLDKEVLDGFLTTFAFYYAGAEVRHSTSNPDTFRLVLDYIWTEVFENKIVNTFEKLSDMFFYKDGDDIKIRPEIITKASQYDNKDWVLVLYPETSRGVISTTPYDLSSGRVPFNPTSKEAIRRMLANLVFYSLFVPRCMANIRITSQTSFLFYDPFGLHTQEYVRSIALGDSDDTIRPRSFFWKEGNGFFTDAKYREFIETFRPRDSSYNDEYITPTDLRNFLKFRPPRGNNMDIKLYLIDKFTKLLERRIEKDNFYEDVDDELNTLIKNLFK